MGRARAEWSSPSPSMSASWMILLMICHSKYSHSKYSHSKYSHGYDTLSKATVILVGRVVSTAKDVVIDVYAGIAK